MDRQKEIEEAQGWLLDQVKERSKALSTGEIISKYKETNEHAPERLIREAIRVLLDSHKLRLRKDLKIESLSLNDKKVNSTT